MSQKYSSIDKINVDKLFPSDNNKSGVRGKRLDIDTMFINTPLNNEPDITFNSDILIKKIKKRRQKKLIHFRNMLRYCHKRIDSADDDQATDIIFNVVDQVPECKEYDPRECLEYISVKLREQMIDTVILGDSTMFITWKYLELKKNDKNNDDKSDDNYDIRS